MTAEGRRIERRCSDVTGQADIAVANSSFTSKIYKRAFPSLEKNDVQVIYPGIDLSAYESLTPKQEKKSEVKLVAS
jgi:hypothetical protein